MYLVHKTILVLSLAWVSTTKAQVPVARCLEKQLSEKCECLKRTLVTIQCASTNATLLYHDFGKITSSGEQVSVLQIRDSDISEWDGLPESVTDTLQELELSNLVYDDLKLNDLLAKTESLTDFRLDNVKIPNLSRISLNLPGTGTGIRVLKLLSDKIEKIDDNYFVHLKSISRLELSDNNLVTIPKAIYQLSSLTQLDLNGNLIKEVTNDDAKALKTLNHLTDLKLDNMNCSCDVGKGEFYSYVKERSFNSVLCRTPSKFDSQSLATKTMKDLCGGSGTIVISYSLLIGLVLWVTSF